MSWRRSLQIPVTVAGWRNKAMGTVCSFDLRVVARNAAAFASDRKMKLEELKQMLANRPSAGDGLLEAIVAASGAAAAIVAPGVAVAAAAARFGAQTNCHVVPQAASASTYYQRVD